MNKYIWVRNVNVLGWKRFQYLPLSPIAEDPATAGKILKLLLQAISKKGFWFKIKAGEDFNPEEYVAISRS